ncbi:MAG: hypothetical protein HXS52_06870 [Theionarchaea archaeon]|nr:hypothetical protein [Theionarchaea archaeon]
MVFAELASLITMVVIGTIIVHLSVSFAGIKNASLKKAFFVALVGSFVGILLGWIPLAGLVIVFVVVMVLVRLAYFTTWPKAFVASVVFLIAIWIVTYLINHLLS